MFKRDGKINLENNYKIEVSNNKVTSPYNFKDRYSPSNLKINMKNKQYGTQSSNRTLYFSNNNNRRNGRERGSEHSRIMFGNNKSSNFVSARFPRHYEFSDERLFELEEENHMSVDDYLPSRSFPKTKNNYEKVSIEENGGLKKINGYRYKNNNNSYSSNNNNNNGNSIQYSKIVSSDSSNHQIGYPNISPMQIKNQRNSSISNENKKNFTKVKLITFSVATIQFVLEQLETENLLLSNGDVFEFFGLVTSTKKCADNPACWVIGVNSLHKTNQIEVEYWNVNLDETILQKECSFYGNIIWSKKKKMAYFNCFSIKMIGTPYTIKPAIINKFIENSSNSNILESIKEQ